jgi:hypothetical protein
MRQQIFIKVREDMNLGGAKAAALTAEGANE